MEPHLENIRLSVQETLDELFIEGLIPFKLNACKVEADVGEYTVSFHDSRMHSISFLRKDGETFRDLVRAAVLARVGHLSGPLRGWVPLASRLKQVLQRTATLG